MQEQLTRTANPPSPGPTGSELPPIPDEYPPNANCWAIFRPRSRTWHQVIRQGSKIISACGRFEMSPETFWAINGKRIAILGGSTRPLMCPECESIPNDRGQR
jgi:hypothetical protein